MRSRAANFTIVCATLSPAAHGQGLGDVGPSFVPLPKPPALEHYLYENPWPPAGLLLLLAIAAFWVLNRSGKPKAGVGAGSVGLLGAVVLVLLAGGIETTRETLADRTRALVRAVDQGDLQAADRILHDVVRSEVPFRSAELGKPILLTSIETWHDRIADARTPTVRAHLDGPDLARTEVLVRTQGEYNGSSWWRLAWRADPGPDGALVWTVTKVTWLWLPGQNNPDA